MPSSRPATPPVVAVEQHDFRGASSRWGPAAGPGPNRSGHHGRTDEDSPSPAARDLAACPRGEWRKRYPDSLSPGSLR